MSRGTYPPILLFLLLLQDASVYLSFVLFQGLVKVAEIPTEMLGNKVVVGHERGAMLGGRRWWRARGEAVR